MKKIIYLLPLLLLTNDIRKIDKNTIELAGRNTDPNKEFCTLERKE